MSKTAVVFWSGTGNTEAMADILAESIGNAGSEVTKYTAGEFSGNMVKDFDAIAFGCPAMGSEELEDSEFLPMFNECEPYLNNKKIALFGSYGWGDGEWMRSWQAACENDGAIIAADPVICTDAPGADTKSSLIELAKALV